LQRRGMEVAQIRTLIGDDGTGKDRKVMADDLRDWFRDRPKAK
jgi:hypothetical protein